MRGINVGEFEVVYRASRCYIERFIIRSISEDNVALSTGRFRKPCADNLSARSASESLRSLSATKRIGNFLSALVVLTFSANFQGSTSLMLRLMTNSAG